MASPFASVIPVWQDPYVEVIKFGMTHRNVGWHAQGEVEQTQDQQIHKNVFRIRGAIAATNYLRVPRDATKGTHGLGLTGRYAYIQMRRVRDLPMTIHLDFVTNKKVALRFTLSSIYQAFRSTGTALRAPLSLDARWTVVVIDMVRLLELHSFNQYARDTYRHLKTVTLCASMNVRNFFVSPTLYTPRTLPANLCFPGAFGDQYRWLVVPSEVSPSLEHPRLDAIQQEEQRIAATPKPGIRACQNSDESTNINQNYTEREKVSQPREAEVEVIMKESPRTKDSNLRRDRNDILSKADQILRDAGIFDVNTATNQESINAAYQSPLDSPSMRFAALTKRGLRSRIVSSSTKAEWPDPILELDRVIGFSNTYPRTLLWLPNSSACIYTSSSTIIVREFYGDNSAPSRTNNPQRVSGRVVKTSGSTEAVKGSVESSGSAIATQENFLYGHSAPICALAVTCDGSLLASAELPTESKLNNGVRLWDLSSRECFTVLRAQPKGVHALCFSTPSKRRLLLCVVGRDECFRTQIFIWDCSCLQHGKEGSVSAAAGAAISLMARQTSDFVIDRIAFSPYEQHDNYHLVSCGRENVRYWRVNPNTGHLTGCPVILNEYSRGTVFTDIGFDTIVESHPSDIRRVRPLYVASSLGTLLVIDYDLKQVLCVYQLHDASINCLSVNEGFCVTGSDDCFLRVWPLDFTDFFLEAHHEAGVCSLDVSTEGTKVLVGSRNNAIGVLDIADQHYTTLLRSHTNEITAISPAPWGSPLASLLFEDMRPGGIGTAESELITASIDGTLRVWDTSSGHQLYEFDMQQDQVTSLAASPSNSGIVAVGFASGCTRIFDVHRVSASVDAANDDNTNKEVHSSVLHEFRQHQSSIRHIEFDADAQHLYTSAVGKQLCLYDARQQDYLPLKMLLVDLDPDDGRFALSQDKKWLALVSGDRQGIIMLDPCSLRVVSTVQPPKTSAISSNGHEEKMKLVRFSNHSTEMLVLSASDRLHIFSLPGRDYVQSMPLLGQDGISALVMSANAKYMATGGTDGSLRVWNWDDTGRIGRMHQSFIGHAGKVKELAFTKDGKSIVASGESSAICIWQFHGDSSPMSPRAKSGISSYAGIEQQYTADGATFECDVDDNADSLCLSSIAGTTSKSNFKLSLEADALKLSSGSDCGKVGSVLSDKTDMQGADAPTLAVSASSNVGGDLVITHAVGGFDPSKFVWSCSTGKLLYTRNSVVVVEDISSGQQMLCNDFKSYGKDRVMDGIGTQSPSVEVVLIVLSPSGEYVAVVSSDFDVLSVRSLVRREDTSSTEKNAAWIQDSDSILIDLLPDTRAVSALAFAQQSHHKPADKLICMACRVGKLHLQQQDAVVVASTAQQSIIWTSLDSNGLEPPSIGQIVPTSDSEFLLLSCEHRSVSTLTVFQDVVAQDGVELCCSADADLQPLVGVFPTQVRQISLYNPEGNVDQLRYLAGIDNDRYCYFYDLKRSTFIATTQLLLLPSKSKNGSSQRSSTTTNSTSRKIVEFMEWATTTGKSLIITGSRNESVLYVHGLPMVSTKHSSRVQIDWQRVARAGVSLLCKVALNGGGLLRGLSVDPARDVGIATTADRTVLLVQFAALPSTKVLRETPSGDIDRNLASPPSHSSWGLDGAVLLSCSHNDSTIRVWLPEISREVASFQVDSAACTCFAVNPFSTTPEGVPQSMVMAAYNDASLRVFDLHEMRLLSRFELTPSPAKSTRYEGAAFHRIVFLGPFVALIETNDHSILLVDISNALELTEEAPSAQGTSIRSTPPRPNARPPKKGKTKTKSRVTDNRRNGREVAYRELNLLPSSYTRRKRLPSLAKSEQMHAEVGAIDVLAASDANIHPFLVVVKYTGPARYKEGRFVVKVFAEPAMSVVRGEGLAPTDEWRLNFRPELDQFAAVFIAALPGTVRVLYTHKQERLERDSEDEAQATDRCSWGMEIRDCTQQCVIQRLAFADPLIEDPVLLRCVHATLKPDSPETEEVVLLMDSQGRVAVLDYIRQLLIPVDTQTAHTLQLQLCRSASIPTRTRNNNTLLLLSSSAEATQLAVASLTFHTN